MRLRYGSRKCSHPGGSRGGGPGGGTGATGPGAGAGFGGGGAASGSPYTLATYTDLTGTFGTVNNLPTNYALFYGPSALQLVPVPEPALILALCAAGAGIVGLRRRKSAISNLQSAIHYS